MGCQNARLGNMEFEYISRNSTQDGLRLSLNAERRCWIYQAGGDGIGAQAIKAQRSSSSQIWRPTTSPFNSMKTKFRRPKKPNEAPPLLNTAIGALELARDNASLKPARDLFHSASVLLATTRVCFPAFMPTDS